MLSSVLRRSVIHPLRRHLVAFNSTTASSATNNDPSLASGNELTKQPQPTRSDHRALLNILHEEGVKQTPGSNPNAEQNMDPSREMSWKNISHGQFILPRQLTHQYQQKNIRRSSRPPAVGPDAAQSRFHDIFYKMGIDPLDHCMNPALLASFVSDMGMIHGRHITKLTSKNQKRIGKAIRRAKMMGIMPILRKPHMRYWAGRK